MDVFRFVYSKIIQLLFTVSLRLLQESLSADWYILLKKRAGDEQWKTMQRHWWRVLCNSLITLFYMLPRRARYTAYPWASQSCRITPNGEHGVWCPSKEISAESSVPLVFFSSLFSTSSPCHEAISRILSWWFTEIKFTSSFITDRRSWFLHKSANLSCFLTSCWQASDQTLRYM